MTGLCVGAGLGVPAWVLQTRELGLLRAKRACWGKAVRAKRACRGKRLDTACWNRVRLQPLGGWREEGLWFWVAEVPVKTLSQNMKRSLMGNVR